MSSTKPTTASISDLAPFVAAVLKDKTVTDLTRENEELREREEERLLVEITGRGGTPVYYQTSLKDGKTHPFQSDIWNVCFKQKKNENGEDIVLPLNLIKNLEIRLGGIVVSDMKYLSTDIEGGGCTFSDNEEDSQIGNIYWGYLDKSISPIQYLLCRVGPVLYKDYLSLIGDNFGGLTDASIDSFPVRFNQTQANLIINGVGIKKEKIGSLLSIVERMGISTKTDSLLTKVERLGIADDANES